MPIAAIFGLLVFSLVPAASAAQSKAAYRGRTADTAEFPYMVFILIKNVDLAIESDFCVNRCAGVIISHWRVITSCHCLLANGLVPKYIELRAGNNEIGSLTREQFRTTHLYSIHPRCVPRTFRYEYDIAMIQLRQKEPWVFGMYVKKVDFPWFEIGPFQKIIEEIRSTGEVCYILGWGRAMCAPENYPELLTSSRNTFIDALRVIELQLISASECESVIKQAVSNSWYKPSKMSYPEPGYSRVTETGHLCAKSSLVKEELGSGDAGGPIICRSKPIGIVSGAYTAKGMNVITFTNMRVAHIWFPGRPIYRNTLPPTT